MAESYFELLTEQQRIPAKVFDSLEELKHLRRRLALRMQNAEQSEPKKTDLPPLPVETEAKSVPLPEATSLETIAKQVIGMKTTLAIWQRTRSRSRSQRGGVFRGHHKLWKKERLPSVVIQYLNTPHGEKLETACAGLMALGIVGVVFGVLSFSRGWESDLSLGSLVCVSGAVIVAIGLGGHFLASFTEPAT